MGACCTSETKPRRQTHYEKREKTNLPLKDRKSKLEDQVDLEDQIKFYINPASGKDISEIKDFFRKNRINVNDYFEKENYDTILTSAIRIKAHPDVVKFILDIGADVNLCEKSTGHSPLILAAMNLNKKIVELILSKNPSLEVSAETNEKKLDLLAYLDLRIRDLKGENTWKEVREVLENYVHNQNNNNYNPSNNFNNRM